MRKRLLVVLVFLLISTGFLARPVYATAGGAKVKIYDLSNSSQLLCTSTTSSPGCANNRVVPGHRYKFDLMEESDPLLLVKKAHLILDTNAGEWSELSWSTTTSGGTPSCTFQSTPTIYLECTSSSQVIGTITINATASSSSSVTSTYGEVDLNGSGYVKTYFLYDVLKAVITVYDCNGNLITRGIGQYNLSYSTCYDIYVKANFPYGGGVDKMELYAADSFTTYSWSNVHTGTVTCTNPDSETYRCVGSSGARQVSQLKLHTTTRATDPPEGSGLLDGSIYILETPTYDHHDGSLTVVLN